MRLVSIITSTYNHRDFIDQCIKSVLAQTYPRWEQIVIDDGSTDETRERVEAFRDQRIRYLGQQHQGIFRLAQTYNRALAAAHGELIAIVEGDDFWPPDKLATLVPTFADPEIVMAFGQTVITRADGAPTRFSIPAPAFIRTFGDAPLLNTPVGAATKAMLRWPGHNYSFPCSVVIRRSALDAIGGFQHINGIPFVDYQTFLALSLVGRYFYAPRVMGFWRRHTRSATALKYQDLTEIRLLAFMRGFLDAHRSTLALTQVEEQTIASALQDWERRIAVYHGLGALRRSRWREARGYFRTARGSRQPLFRLAGATGTIASYLHVKLEWLVAVAGRLLDRQARWTGVQRRLSGDTASHQDSADAP